LERARLRQKRSAQASRFLLCTLNGERFLPEQLGAHASATGHEQREPAHFRLVLHGGPSASFEACQVFAQTGVYRQTLLGNLGFAAARLNKI
jgi:hypothetical protein